jgi:hypothetical protein
MTLNKRKNDDSLVSGTYLTPDSEAPPKSLASQKPK